MSLASRLVILFGAIAALTFALAGFYLYRSLAVQLEKRDDADLLGKVELIRHLLLEAESTTAISEDPHRFLDAIAHHPGLLFGVRSLSNEMLVANAPLGMSFPEVTLVTSERKPDYSDVTLWTTSEGLRGRAIAAEGRVGGAPSQKVQITVARQGSERAGLLAAYQRDALAAATGGTLLAILLGYGLVRGGLLPVRDIAAKARQISATQLDARLQLSGAPQSCRSWSLPSIKCSIASRTGWTDCPASLRTSPTIYGRRSRIFWARPKSCSLGRDPSSNIKRCSNRMSKSLSVCRA